MFRQGLFKDKKSSSGYCLSFEGGGWWIDLSAPDMLKQTEFVTPPERGWTITQAKGSLSTLTLPSEFIFNT